MLKSTIIDEVINKLRKVVLILMFAKIELSLLDLPFHIDRPVVSFLLTGKMIADSRIAFDADDCSPSSYFSFFIFAFIN